ncbi:uncharacterized protein [Medicago truncatula]|uniref:uncharacterized protein n=1 Tax=Medicago truncatula TaxID=3880 RepID=UPI000D2F3B7B|nr:uncharacterized protein LOC112418595 [Medicago truncatula]
MNSTIATISSQLQLTHQAFGNSPSVSHILTPKMVTWQHGDEDTMILNVDGSALANLGKVGYGGLISKHDGNFQLGFFESVGIFNILHAEIQALWIGIKLCWEAGYKKLMCYSDSLHVVQLVSTDTPRFHHYANILKLIGNYLAKDLTVTIYHILREGNSCADVLAKLGLMVHNILSRSMNLPLIYHLF